MIILEGPDNSGKSTLAEKLSKDFGLPVWHAGGPGYSTSRLRDEMVQITKRQICDRVNFISGPVYERALKKHNDYETIHDRADENTCQHYLKHLLSHDLVCVIWCVGVGEPTSRHGESEAYLAEIELKYREIEHAYMSFFSPVLYRVVMYDFRTDSYEYVADEIEKFLMRNGDACYRAPLLK